MRYLFKRAANTCNFKPNSILFQIGTTNNKPNLDITLSKINLFKIYRTITLHAYEPLTKKASIANIVTKLSSVNSSFTSNLISTETNNYLVSISNYKLYLTIKRTHITASHSPRTSRAVPFNTTFCKSRTSIMLDTSNICFCTMPQRANCLRVRLAFLITYYGFLLDFPHLMGWKIIPWGVRPVALMP